MSAVFINGIVVFVLAGVRRPRGHLQGAAHAAHPADVGSECHLGHHNRRCRHRRRSRTRVRFAAILGFLAVTAPRSTWSAASS